MSHSSQITLVSLEELVSPNHNYRKFAKLFDFKLVERKLKGLEREDKYKGYGILRLFKCLLLQFMEDLSDRELMRFLEENMAGKWFCGFNLTESTPDYSAFSRLRSKIGTKLLSEIYAEFRDQLSRSGYISEVFTFVDASHLISKANLWQERDNAIAAKYEKLNNKSLPKVSNDKHARIGCKGGDKFWYGYKKHVSLDMQSGMINKVAVTPANVTDAKGFRHISPRGGAVYADKGYCTKPAKQFAQAKGVHLAAVKKNNMGGKNYDQDKYYTKLRSPYERVFAKQNRRVRYVGIAKNQFAEFFNAICFNLRRLIVISPPDLVC